MQHQQMTPILFDCCYDCSAYSNKQKVDVLFHEHLPSESAWHHARDRMLLPILQRMALASEGIMPMRWTVLENALPKRITTWKETDLVKRKIKLYFLRLCAMVRSTYEQYLAYDLQDESTFFHAFASTAQSAMHGLTAATPPLLQMRSPEAMHLWYQIKLIKNEDPVNDLTYNTASRMRWRNENALWKASAPAHFITPQTTLTSAPRQLHVQTFLQYGALEYGLALTQQLKQVARQSYDCNTTQGALRMESLGNFAGLIQQEIDHQADRRLVLAAAIKDTESTLHILGADMLRLIGQHLWQPDILRWEDVMRPYIAQLDNSPPVL